ncbi:hypothetical protein ATANTOWER_023421, partial [Ataeniobius toweri]|nr:hypothetical protein [Ataeniobius toweri]
NNYLCLCSVLLGCSCCSTVDETITNIARGLANKMKEKTHWAAGRVGDIDFIGPTKTKGKFVRVCSNTDPVLIYKMLTEEWGLSPPHLVVALVGGDELAQMKPWLRDTLRKGLVKAAQSTGYNQWAKAGLGFLHQRNNMFLAFC